MKTADLHQLLYDGQAQYLLTMKRISIRPKDRLDVVALERIKRGENPNV